MKMFERKKKVTTKLNNSSEFVMPQQLNTNEFHCG